MTLVSTPPEARVSFRPLPKRESRFDPSPWPPPSRGGGGLDRSLPAPIGTQGLAPPPAGWQEPAAPHVPHRPPSPTAPSCRILLALDRMAFGAILLMPLLLMHAHGIAEGAIAVAGICFLRALGDHPRMGLAAHAMAARRAWPGGAGCHLLVADTGSWARRIWRHALAVQAVLIVRFVFLSRRWSTPSLRDPAPRRWLGYALAASAAYIVIQSPVQFASGATCMAKAAAPTANSPARSASHAPARRWSRILFPALLPAVADLLRRPGIWPHRRAAMPAAVRRRRRHGADRPAHAAAADRASASSSWR